MGSSQFFFYAFFCVGFRQKLGQKLGPRGRHAHCTQHHAACTQHACNTTNTNTNTTTNTTTTLQECGGVCVAQNTEHTTRNHACTQPRSTHNSTNTEHRTQHSTGAVQHQQHQQQHLARQHIKQRSVDTHKQQHEHSKQHNNNSNSTNTSSSKNSTSSGALLYFPTTNYPCPLSATTTPTTENTHGYVGECTTRDSFSLTSY